MKIMDSDEVAQNEMDVLKKLEHKNNIKYYDHFQVKISNIQNSKLIKLGVVTEYCEVLTHRFCLCLILYFKRSATLFDP